MKTMLIILMILCPFMGWGNDSAISEDDSITRVKMSDVLLDLIDVNFDRINDFYNEIVQRNEGIPVDEKIHRKGCSWLVEFDNTSDTTWFTLTLIDPWISEIVQEHFESSTEMLPKITFQGVSRDGLKVYMTGSNNDGLYTQTNESIPLDKEPSYFEYGIIVGRFCYSNNTITKVSLIIDD